MKAKVRVEIGIYGDSGNRSQRRGLGLGYWVKEGVRVRVRIGDKKEEVRIGLLGERGGQGQGWDRG